MFPGFYKTLNEALAEVCARSFYEECRVFPFTNGTLEGYVVSDVEESLGIECEDVEGRMTVYGRHSEAKSFSQEFRMADPSSIRCYFRRSVEILEERRGYVAFSYQIVYDYTMPQEDNIVAWALVSRISEF